MPLLPRNILIAVGLAIGVTAANAAGIGPGSPAPALDVKTWYKGTPVKGFDNDKIYVVEFWATWCGPCKQSIPHLTELAKKNTDVTFIGVSIWEDDNGTNIKKFVDEMGDKMDYNVCYSGNQTGMAETWMKAAAQNGIPSAFIIKNGQIQWVGHPMSMEKPLEDIKTGKFDLAAFKVEFEKSAEETRQQMAAREALGNAQKLIVAGKLPEAKAAISDIETKYPAVKPMVENLKFSLLAKEDPKAWETKAKTLAKDPASAQTLLSFAMTQLPNGDIAHGAKAIDLAVGAAKDGDLLTFYDAAVFYDQTKDYKKALSMIDRALASLPNSQFKDNKDAKTAIEKMKSDIAAKAKAASS